METIESTLSKLWKIAKNLQQPNECLIEKKKWWNPAEELCGMLTARPPNPRSLSDSVVILKMAAAFLVWVSGVGRSTAVFVLKELWLYVLTFWVASWRINAEGLPSFHQTWNSLFFGIPKDGEVALVLLFKAFKANEPAAISCGKGLQLGQTADVLKAWEEKAKEWLLKSFHTFLGI